MASFVDFDDRVIYETPSTGGQWGTIDGRGDLTVLGVSLTLTVLVTACTAIFVRAHIKDRLAYIEEDKKNKEGEDKENQESAQAAADADSQESSGGE